jgi:hypothetical protein
MSQVKSVGNQCAVGWRTEFLFKVKMFSLAFAATFRSAVSPNRPSLGEENMFTVLIFFGYFS